MPRNSLIIFRDIAGRTAMLVVDCRRCPRKGRYRLDKLIARYGLDEPVATFVDSLTADCPHKMKPNASIYDRCRAQCPTLPTLFPPRPLPDRGRRG